MENNANYALVGVIASAIVISLFGFIYWFAGPSSNVATKSYEVVFTGTVSGIGRGTDVLFNGVKVGQVRAVTLDPGDTTHVVARIEVSAAIPVRADTRVLMGFQGLTGVGSVQMSGGTQAAGEPLLGPGRKLPTLYAEVSDFQSILDGLSSTINGASTAVNRLNGFLDANDAKLNTTIDNVEVFSTALAQNADGVGEFLASISEAGREIGPMASEIKSLSADLRNFVEAVPPEKVAKIVNDVSVFSEGLARNTGRIDDFFTTTAGLAKNLTELTDGLSVSVKAIDKVAAEIDPAVVGRVMSNVDTFSKDINSLTADVRSVVAAIKPEQVSDALSDVGVFTKALSRNSDQIDAFFAATSKLSSSLTEIFDGLGSSVKVIDQVTAAIDPEAVGRVIDNVDVFAGKLGQNADNVDTILSNAASVSKSAVSSVDQVNEILAKVNGLVSEADGKGMFDEITAAAVSVRNLADQLKTSTASIAQGLSNFTTRGLPEYSALGAEARATLQRLDRVVRNLESNPQGLLFGGETVREYNKQ